jgi:hypothetical protein
MNQASAAREQTESTVSHTVPVVVLGTDAMLAAAPYTAVQLAHACLQAGYASVVPASWGDELIAAAVLRRLPSFGQGPAIQCSCPIVAHRLLTTGGDLRPVMLPLVSPPVALARYLRAVSQPTRVRITYVGGCPGAVDDAIDIRMSPETLIGMLAERQIVLDEQPRVFESIIPPDRRRYFSQPGGVPSAERLWTDLGARAFIEVESDDFVSEIAEHLFAGEHVLMDVAPRLGCVCSGAIAPTAPRDARAAVVALEPPRSAAPVVEEQTPLDLDLPIPAVPRTPVDVVLAARMPASPLGLPTPPGSHRATPTVTEPRTPRATPASPPRPIGGVVPTARNGDGKALPRAYVARRRHSAPKGNTVLPASAEEPATNASPETVEPTAAPETPHEPPEALSAVELPAAASPPQTETPIQEQEADAPTHSVSDSRTDEVTIVDRPPSPVSNAEPPKEPLPAETITPAIVGTETDSAEVVDLHQLHFEGIVPPIPERLPIFSPNPVSTPAAEAPPSHTPAREAKRRSRAPLYLLIAAIAVLVVAGVAYFANRSADAPSPPTSQLP